MSSAAPAAGPFDWAETAAALNRDGFCVVPGVLDPEMLAHVRGLSQAMLDDADPEHRAQQRATGSLIQLADEPRYSELIAWKPALAALDRLRLGGARYSSGYVISKPGGGPPLFWHQDWWGWDHPLSYTDAMLQVFVMYYLTDTSVANGCLRVIPGSHRHRHRCHGLLTQAHAEKLAKAGDLTDPAFGQMEGEVAVPVRAGDMVIGDARLLHAAHANTSAAERTLLTLWYHPHFAEQPGPLRARVAKVMHREEVDTDPGADNPRFPDSWPPDARARIAPLLVSYDGADDPQPWNRVPDHRLV